MRKIAHYKIENGQEQPRTTGAASCVLRPTSCYAFVIATFSSYNFFPFLNIRQLLAKPAQQRPGKCIIRGLLRGWTWLFHPNILSIPPLNFSGRAAKSVKLWLDFQHQSRWTRCSFEMEQHLGNLILPAWATMADLRSDSDLLLVSPLYRRL